MIESGEPNNGCFTRKAIPVVVAVSVRPEEVGCRDPNEKCPR